MPFNATTEERAISARLQIVSANLVSLRSAGMFNKRADPITYVSIHVDKSKQRTTCAKSRHATSNPLWEEHLAIIVKPQSTIHFDVMSFRKSHADRVIGQGSIDIASIVSQYPPTTTVANVAITLVRPTRESLGVFQEEILDEKVPGIFPTLTAGECGKYIKQ